MSYIEPKPILRQEAFTNIQFDLTKIITRSNVYQNCLNCKNWNLGQDLCSKFNVKPPTDVIVYSCPEYTDNEDIPF